MQALRRSKLAQCCRREAEVSGIPLGQRGGSEGHVAPIGEYFVVPATRWPSHPTRVMADRVQEGDAAGVPIYCEPGRRMPQEEGGWVSLLARGVDLLIHTCGRRRGGGVEGIHLVRFQDGGVVAAKRVRLWPGKIRTVRANLRRQIWLSYEAGGGEGAKIAGPKA